jgi:hypothetical protein
VSGPSFYVDGVLYRTVGTPTDLSGTGAPADSFDVIYEFFGLQPNVATAALATRATTAADGPFMACALATTRPAVATYDRNGSGDLDSDEEVVAALAGGAATDIGVVKWFECPVIPLPQSG